jgi:hypothetical protein
VSLSIRLQWSELLTICCDHNKLMYHTSYVPRELCKKLIRTCDPRNEDDKCHLAMIHSLASAFRQCLTYRAMSSVVWAQLDETNVMENYCWSSNSDQNSLMERHPKQLVASGLFFTAPEEEEELLHSIPDAIYLSWMWTWSGMNF